MGKRIIVTASPFICNCCYLTTCHTKILCYKFLFRFSPDLASRRGLNAAELSAVEAIHRAVEFNPHVPKVSSLLYGSFVILVLNTVLQIKRWSSFLGIRLFSQIHIPPHPL